MEVTVMQRYPRGIMLRRTERSCVSCMQKAEDIGHTIDDCVSTVEALLKGLKIEAAKQHTENTG
ncbi:hypothetical protein LCGC14_1643310 [marine sediment metagenome]|uniref:Uncharacterized protein n=1 Tax=marine sediment metagenome TaxID=412755 RepID=A0A0F9ILJ4_9ZZZZ